MMATQNGLKISLNQVFGNIVLPLWISFKKMIFNFVHTIYHFLELYDPKKVENEI